LTFDAQAKAIEDVPNIAVVVEPTRRYGFPSNAKGPYSLAEAAVP